MCFSPQRIVRSGSAEPRNEEGTANVNTNASLSGSSGAPVIGGGTGGDMATSDEDNVLFSRDTMDDVEPGSDTLLSTTLTF